MEYAAQILLLSPDATLLQAAQQSLSSLGHHVLLARSLSQAQRTLTRVRADVICLDSVLPEDELDEFSRWLRRDGDQPSPSVIFLAPPSARMVPSTLPAFYRRGDYSVVQKPLESDELVREVTRLLAARPRGETEATLLRVGPIALDGAARRLLFAAGGALAVTPTEYRLLRCLMERPGEFVSPEQLLTEVWGYPPDTGGAEIVRAHVSNLRRKLRLMGEDPQLLRTIPYQGYAIVAEEAERTVESRA
ncbi:MAG: response regulator transcription factor [Chloroflexi bacterium]|nr:response regulator transcription factor [Chloroflexota bacterium]